jgi:hypothetical protein
MQVEINALSLHFMVSLNGEDLRASNGPDHALTAHPIAR